MISGKGPEQLISPAYPGHTAYITGQVDGSGSFTPVHTDNAETEVSLILYGPYDQLDPEGGTVPKRVVAVVRVQDDTETGTSYTQEVRVFMRREKYKLDLINGGKWEVEEDTYSDTNIINPLVRRTP